MEVDRFLTDALKTYQILATRSRRDRIESNRKKPRTSMFQSDARRSSSQLLRPRSPSAAVIATIWSTTSFLASESMVLLCRVRDPYEVFPVISGVYQFYV